MPRLQGFDLTNKRKFFYNFFLFMPIESDYSSKEAEKRQRSAKKKRKEWEEGGLNNVIGVGPDCDQDVRELLKEARNGKK